MLHAVVVRERKRLTALVDDGENGVGAELSVAEFIHEARGR